IIQVNSVLETIGGDTVPQIMVYNKIDLVPDLTPRLDHLPEEQMTRVWVSAFADQGMDELRSAMITMLGEDLVQKLLILKPEETRIRAKLYDLEAVQSETIDEEGNFHLLVRLHRIELEKLFH